MPGRQSTRPPILRTKAPPKPKAKRSQNALAIAEAQDPIRSKIRQHRLGHSEPDQPKRKRDAPAEKSDLEEGLGNSKRRKSVAQSRDGNDVERGSDSSGNEWTVGQVDDDNDSEIDSDEAMAESDNEGANIKGSKSYSVTDKRSQKGSASIQDDVGLPDIDLREDEDDEAGSGAESDSFGDEAVDLAAVLDQSDDGEGLSSHSADLGDSQGEESEAESDEDMDNEAVEEESTPSFSGDEDGTEDPSKLESLQAFVSTMNEQDQSSNRTRAPIDAQKVTTLSGNGVNPGRQLRVADLAPSVTDPTTRNTHKLLVNDKPSKFSKKSGIPKKLDVPLPKRQQDRLDRAAAYEKSKETLNRWIDTVKHNRRAEHLSFPLKDPNAAAAQGSTRLLPTSQSRPLTDLEDTIQNILQDSGLAGSKGKSEEDKLQAFEELKTNKMPLEEVQARRAELRRARELLFREEIRAKRIKKIKSKSYRKVHRKERERNLQQEKDALAAAGVDDSESEKERNDRRRAEERMGGRHRESRWAKGIKESGRSKWDEDARGGVTEMARRGEELRRRIEGKAIAQDEDELDSSESEEDDDEVFGDFQENRNNDRKQLERLHRLSNDDEPKASTSGSRLASMDFMKRAEEARKARNQADLESLRRDFTGEETPSEDETEGPGRKVFGPTDKKQASKTIKKPARNEFEEKEDRDDENEISQSKPDDEELEIVVDGLAFRGKEESTPKLSMSDQCKRGKQKSKETLVEMNENPWLMPSKKVSNFGKKREKDSDTGPIVLNNLPIEPAPATSSNQAPRSALKGSREAEQARQSVRSTTPILPNPVHDHEDKHEDDESSETEHLPFVLRNQDLVRKAFAGDSVVADFTAEKTATIASDSEKTIDHTLPGWGTWTGAGLSKKAQARNKGKILIKQPGIAKEKRKDAKLDRVIINEKRVKKNGKFLAPTLPHPFETRGQYERSLRMPVGPEFTTKIAFQDGTKPRVLMKQGIIRPMVKPMV
ncbi:hypothetical protein ACLMJK_005441 [Lecanora helva]